MAPRARQQDRAQRRRLGDGVSIFHFPLVQGLVALNAAQLAHARRQLDFQALHGFFGLVQPLAALFVGADQAGGRGGEQVEQPPMHTREQLRGHAIVRLQPGGEGDAGVCARGGKAPGLVDGSGAGCEVEGVAHGLHVSVEGRRPTGGRLGAQLGRGDRRKDKALAYG